MNKNTLTKFLTLFLCLMFLGGQIQAQDTQFSQFFTAPVYMNPAMIGFSEAPRFTINFRDHLPSFNNQFITAAVAYDQHLHEMNSSFGINLAVDRAGGLMNTYFLNGNFAYNLPLGTSMNFKGGFQLGVIQQSIGTDDIIFSDMIDVNSVTGTADLPTAEPQLATTSNTKLDIGAGFVLYNQGFYAGASFKHLTQPTYDFTGFGDDANKLSILSSVHIGKAFYLNDPFLEKNRWSVVPNVLATFQGKYKQVNAGAYVGYGYIFGGLWLRHTIKNSDALITMIGFKKGIFRVGYSYDFDLGKIASAAGAHELSLTFDLGNDPSNKRKVRLRNQINCPTMFQ